MITAYRRVPPMFALFRSLLAALGCPFGVWTDR